MEEIYRTYWEDVFDAALKKPVMKHLLRILYKRFSFPFGRTGQRLTYQEVLVLTCMVL
jgi:hypothetical protein